MLDAESVKNKITEEQIIKLCCHLQGSDEVLYDTQGHPIFSTILDHPDSSGSFKEYYFHETGLFHCFTRGVSYDLFEMVSRARGCDFKEAFNFVVSFLNLRVAGFSDEEVEENLTSDWDIFQRIQDYSKAPAEDNTVITPIAENLLDYFYPLAAPIEWQREGITPEVMYEYGVRVDTALYKIVIAHRDAAGNLIGIRGRAYDPKELAEGKKYMPIFIEGTMYNHPLAKNLYGLYNNQETIRKTKKAFVVEGEKSVLQLASMYGIDNCFAVATCGSSFSKYQMDLLLDLGVEEIILAYDREFQGGKGAPDTVEYEQKLFKIVAPLLPYVNVSVIMDYDHLTPYKASSTDCGKEIFEKLYHARVRLSTPAEEIKTKTRKVR